MYSIIFFMHVCLFCFWCSNIFFQFHSHLTIFFEQRKKFSSYLLRYLPNSPNRFVTHFSHKKYLILKLWGSTTFSLHIMCKDFYFNVYVLLINVLLYFTTDFVTDFMSTFHCVCNTYVHVIMKRTFHPVFMICGCHFFNYWLQF